jgi:D-alanyl-lipoteichoic acid acyltransferase DltB (MBOAT superfamily)
MEFANQKQQLDSKVKPIEKGCSKGSDSKCESCQKGKFCLKYLQEVSISIQDYNWYNYLIYIFYPPLYFSGPTVLYNSFIYQVNLNYNQQNRLPHTYFWSREKIKYIIRYVFVFICFEIFNSYIYVNAYLTNRYNSFVWKDLSYYSFALFCFFLLIFIWFKFTVIWRTSRIWAWLDGVYTEENMNRCMYNNYCFEGFWRAWHRSFNIWLIKYIFVPLGGSKYKVVNIWVVFSFVALWHDLQLNLLLWGWFICFFLIPEILVKNYFNRPEV